METAVITDTLRTSNTHTPHEVVIVQAICVIDCTCDDVTGGRWNAEDRVWPWDSSGCGDYQVAGGRKCGKCGSYLHPAAILLVDPTVDEIASAEAAVIAEFERRRREELARVRRLVACMLEDADLTDLRGSEDKPGVYVDGDQLIAWLHHPESHIETGRHYGEVITEARDLTPAELAEVASL